MKAIRTAVIVCWVAACLGIAGFAQVSPETSTSPTPIPQQAEHSTAELAKKLSNPVAAMISVPFQNNFDTGMGPGENGFRYTMNFQPVVPMTLTADWNLISRTIVPFIHQSDVVGTSSQTGIGDILQSFFISPRRSKVVWGAGPVLLIPSATDKWLGTGRFGIGPTLVVLKQEQRWTYCALFNHVWSVAGDDTRSDVSSTFLEPFLSYTTRTAWTIGVNTESTYDWTAEKWAVPIHFSVSKLVRFEKQPMSFGVGPRCWATSPAGGPHGCVVRFT
jgi:hypothetical protein